MGFVAVLFNSDWYDLMKEPKELDQDSRSDDDRDSDQDEKTRGFVGPHVLPAAARLVQAANPGGLGERNLEATLVEGLQNGERQSGDSLLEGVWKWKGFGSTAGGIKISGTPPQLSLAQVIDEDLDDGFDAFVNVGIPGDVLKERVPLRNLYREHGLFVFLYVEDWERYIRLLVRESRTALQTEMLLQNSRSARFQMKLTDKKKLRLSASLVREVIRDNDGPLIVQGCGPFAIIRQV
jgi:hypothetical protein